MILTFKVVHCHVIVMCEIVDDMYFETDKVLISSVILQIKKCYFNMIRGSIA